MGGTVSQPDYGMTMCGHCGQQKGHSYFCPVGQAEQMQNAPSLSEVFRLTPPTPFVTGLSAVKPSNPKDALGANRAPLSMVSDLAEAEESLAMLEGGLKYGLYNYRGVGVRVSVYLDAAMRHIRRFKNGEDRDPKTDVHHLGYARACLGIIFESIAMGNLQDDRPPRCPGFIERLDAMEARVKHLKEVFKDYTPEKHWTIEDKL